MCYRPNVMMETKNSWKTRDHVRVPHGLAGQNLMSVETVIVYTETVIEILSDSVSRLNISGVRARANGVQTHLFLVWVRTLKKNHAVAYIKNGYHGNHATKHV